MNDTTSLLERPIVEPAIALAWDQPTLERVVRRRPWLIRVVVSTTRGGGLATEWVFGVVCLILGLSILAALPLLQFLSLGYLMECSARVARSGRLRDGLVGVRRAAKVGGVIAGGWLSLVPLWLAGSLARSAEVIDPGGPIARGWKIGLIIITGLHLSGTAAKTVADEIAWVAASCLSLSCLLSYIAIRREPESTVFEVWADRIFLVENARRIHDLAASADKTFL